MGERLPYDEDVRNEKDCNKTSTVGTCTCDITHSYVRHDSVV